MFRRIMAYLIDTIIIVLCVQIIGSNKYINKDYEKYEELSNEYLEVNEKYTKALNEIETVYKDEKLEDEELSKYEDKYKDIDFKLDKDEKYNDCLVRFNKKYLNVVNEYNYKLSKYSIIMNIVTVVLMILYFGFIEYVFDGQTLGKKIFKFRVDRTDDKELSLKDTMIRALIITGSIFTIIELILIMVASKSVFMNVDLFISLLSSTIEIACGIMILVRKDNRGLHELLSNTKVTDLKENIIIEE